MRRVVVHSAWALVAALAAAQAQEPAAPEPEPVIVTLAQSVVNSGKQLGETSALVGEMSRAEARRALRELAKGQGKGSLTRLAQDHARASAQSSRAALQNLGRELEAINNLQNAYDVGSEAWKGNYLQALKNARDAYLSTLAASKGAEAGAALGLWLGGPAGAAIGGFGGAFFSTAIYRRFIGFLESLPDIDESNIPPALQRVRSMEELRIEWDSLCEQRHVPPDQRDGAAFDLWILERQGQLGDRAAVEAILDRNGLTLPSADDCPPVSEDPPEPDPERRLTDGGDRFGADTTWWPTTGDDPDLLFTAQGGVTRGAPRERPPVPGGQRDGGERRPVRLEVVFTPEKLEYTIGRAGNQRYEPSNRVVLGAYAVYADGGREDVTRHTTFEPECEGNSFSLGGKSIQKYPPGRPVAFTARYGALERRFEVPTRKSGLQAMLEAVREADEETERRFGR